MLESDSGAGILGASSTCSVMQGESLSSLGLSFLLCQMEAKESAFCKVTMKVKEENPPDIERLLGT